MPSYQTQFRDLQRRTLKIHARLEPVKRAELAPEDALSAYEPEAVPPPWPGRSVLVDGVATHVRETPSTAEDPEPALYVHGLGGSAQNWTDLAGLLAHRLHGLAADLPGFGHSDPPPPGGYRQAALANHLVRLIEETGRGPVHLFGNSLGGALTVRVAALRPDLVRSLTLISPAMPIIQPRQAHARMLPVLMVPNLRRQVERRVRAVPPEQLARGVLSFCFADTARIAPQRLAEAVEEAAHRQQVPWAADAYIQTLRGLAGSYFWPGQRSLWGLATRITAPTLVVWGRHDRVIDPRLAVRTTRVIRDSRLLILDRVGHTAQMEVPRILARASLAFLTEVGLPAAPVKTDSGGPIVAPAARGRLRSARRRWSTGSGLPDAAADAAM
jgi:pimeloyl-ACP methyl ester carboxylesterase